MWERLDGYVKAIWTKTGLRGIVTLVLLALAVIVALGLLAYFVGADLGGWLNNLLGVQ